MKTLNGKSVPDVKIAAEIAYTLDRVAISGETEKVALVAFGHVCGWAFKSEM